jgi:hypothetical protein
LPRLPRIVFSYEGRKEVKEDSEERKRRKTVREGSGGKR